MAHLDLCTPTAFPGPARSVATVRAAHILCKHRDSRRPSSWREQNITRTKEEAIEIIKGSSVCCGLQLSPFAWPKTRQTGSSGRPHQQLTAQPL